MSALVVVLDEKEVACAIVEGTVGVKRTAGMTAEQALQRLDPSSRTEVMQAAARVLDYVRAQVRNATVTS